MFQIKLSESTAARRRIPILLVDSTDGYTAKTSITSPTLKISKNGGTQVSATGTFSEIGTGQYYYEFASGEVDTLGWISFNLQKTGCRDYNAIVQIMAYDALDATRLGLTALPNAAAEASGGLATLSAAQASNGTIPVDVIKISGDATAADNLESATDGTGYNVGGGSIVSASVTGNVGGNVTGSVGSVTGNVGGNIVGSVASVTNAVTVGTINSNVITAASIQNGAITNVKFAAGAITSSVFATDAITATVIAADAITSAELASSSVNEIADTVWGANVDTNSSGSAWGGNTFGRRSLRTTTGASYEVQVTDTNHISASVHEMQSGVITSSSIAAGAIDANAIAANAIDASALAADAIAEIADGVWDEQLSGHLTVGSTGEALDDAAQGGGGGSTTTYVTGNLPYRVKSDEQFPGGVVDIGVGTLMRLDLQMVDRDDNPINLTGGTVTVGVRNASTGATVGTDQSATLSLARLGYIYVDTVADWSATAGTYRITVSATLGSDVIVAGPLQLIVRTR